jgi:hypothetical protein
MHQGQPRGPGADSAGINSAADISARRATHVAPGESAPERAQTDLKPTLQTPLPQGRERSRALLME